MLLFCHPTGGLPVRQAALALNEAGLLGEFWTCIHYQPRGLLGRLLPERVARQLGRRSFPPELAGRIRAAPVRELVRLLAPRAGLRRLVRRENGWFSGAAVQRALDRRASARLAAGNFGGVYAYEGGAERLFGTARERGLARLYDLPRGYWREPHRLLEEEAHLAPDWAPSIARERAALGSGERRDAELALAELVLVPSTFALTTLDLAPEFHGTAAVIPYGAPRVAPRPRLTRSRGQPLRVLFVGALEPQKGLRYLFAACRQLGPAVELTLIGNRPAVSCAPLEVELEAHRWIPACPQERVLDEMSRHDVLVLPALFDGFGLPLLEAMAAGLPVITTPHTAGPDLINDGEQGFIVPIRSADAIAEKLDRLRREPELARAMGGAGRLRAAQTTWEDYRSNLAACTTSVLAAR